MISLYRAEVRANLALAAHAESLANCRFFTDECREENRRLAASYRSRAAKWLRRMAMLPR